MPLFADSFTDDEEIIAELATGVAEFWNSSHGPELFGCEVLTSMQAVRQVSREADQVLSYFPDPPGPFKRLATLLVLARLCPLFFLAKSGPLGPKGERLRWGYEQEQVWLPRISFLLIQPVLDILRVIDPRTGQEHMMDEWKGFPSAHSKAEFLLLLEWMRDYSSEQLDNEENLARRGRMVLAISLILESVYYQGGSPPRIVGMCDHGLGDLTCVTFDGYLLHGRI